MKLFNTIIAVFTITTLASSGQVSPDPGTFVFQGHLELVGEPMNDQINFRFDLYDQETGGTLLESVTKFVSIENGHFAVPLTFSNLGDGDPRWLELLPSLPGDAPTDPPTLIEPRQALHFAPLARWAASAGNAQAADTLKPGAVVNGDVSFTGNITADGQISGNGSQITGLPLASTSGVLPGTGLSGSYGSPVNFSSSANTFAGSFSGTFSGNGAGLKGIWRLTPPPGAIADREVLKVDQRGWIGVNQVGFTGNPFSEFDVRGTTRSDGFTLSSGSVSTDAMATIGAEHRTAGFSLGMRFQVDNVDTAKTALEIASTGNATFKGAVHVEGGLSGDGSGLTNLDTSNISISSLDAPNGGFDGVVRVRNFAGGITEVAISADTVFKEKLTVQGSAEVKTLKIVGGADIAEPFDVAASEEIDAIPGMVVTIDANKPGALKVSSSAYDRTVAGIISGAGGVNPGMMLSQEGTAAQGEHPVALAGRVYCYVSADQGGAVVPGDLLTTSNTPGHAMKVTDHTQASGAIIGKAMTSLDEGNGLVLVLVSLQ